MLARGDNRHEAPTSPIKLKFRNKDMLEILGRFNKGNNNDLAPSSPIF